MIARGYRVYVTLPTDYPSNSILQLEVAPTRPHQPPQVLADLGQCAKVADKAQDWSSRTTTEKVATILGPGFLSMAAAMSAVDRQEAAYDLCLGERGYAVQRYQPAPRGR